MISVIVASVCIISCLASFNLPYEARFILSKLGHANEIPVLEQMHAHVISNCPKNEGVDDLNWAQMAFAFESSHVHQSVVNKLVRLLYSHWRSDILNLKEFDYSCSDYSLESFMKWLDAFEKKMLESGEHWSDLFIQHLKVLVDALDKCSFNDPQMTKQLSLKLASILVPMGDEDVSFDGMFRWPDCSVQFEETDQLDLFRHDVLLQNTVPVIVQDLMNKRVSENRAWPILQYYLSEAEEVNSTEVGFEFRNLAEVPIYKHLFPLLDYTGNGKLPLFKSALLSLLANFVERQRALKHLKLANVHVLLKDPLQSLMFFKKRNLNPKILLYIANAHLSILRSLAQMCTIHKAKGYSIKYAHLFDLQHQLSTIPKAIAIFLKYADQENVLLINQFLTPIKYTEAMIASRWMPDLFMMLVLRKHGFSGVLLLERLQSSFYDFIDHVFENGTLYFHPL